MHSAQSSSSSSSSTESSASSADSNADLTGISPLSAGGKYETNDNGQTWKYVYQDNPLKGLYNDNGKIVYFDGYDGTQARGTIYNVDNANYVFDKSDGYGTKIDEISGGQYKYESTSDGKGGQNNFWVYQTSDGIVPRIF
ncbi:hypothetical protein ACYATO_01695 [Lactobacillaceae bacterium Melli_B3]